MSFSTAIREGQQADSDRIHALENDNLRLHSNFEKEHAKVVEEHGQELLLCRSQLEQVTANLYTKQEQLSNESIESKKTQAILGTTLTALGTAKAQNAAQASTIEDLVNQLWNPVELLDGIQQSLSTIMEDVTHIKHLLITQQGEASTIQSSLDKLLRNRHKKAFRQSRLPCCI